MLDRICSETFDFDHRCNELESWLMKRGYDEKLIRKKVLDARKHKRNDLLNGVRSDKKHKVTLNITFHPEFQNLNKLLRKLHLILTCDDKHQQVFKDIPIFGFRKGKSLSNFLVGAQMSNSRGKSKGCL